MSQNVPCLWIFSTASTEWHPLLSKYVLYMACMNNGGSRNVEITMKLVSN